MKSNKVLLLLVLTALALWTAVFVLPDNQLHVVFCDVGQGDGILVYHRHSQLIVDMGPDNSMAECLSRHMPFYDRTIEAAIITHPQQDHMGGFSAIVQSYTLLQLFVPPVSHTIDVYRQLVAAQSRGDFRVANLYTGESFALGPMQFRGIWPSRDFLAEHAIATQNVLGWASDKTDLNSYGITGVLSYGQFDVLFTADTDHLVQPAQLDTGLLRPVEVLKAPHHGGKDSVTPDWLTQVHPQLTVISVGKNNRYDHPRADTLAIYQSQNVPVLRTDLNGDIEIVSNGKQWWVKNPHGNIER